MTETICLSIALLGGMMFFIPFLRAFVLQLSPPSFDSTSVGVPAAAYVRPRAPGKHVDVSHSLRAARAARDVYTARAML
jgi:hypothetical protein